MEKVRKLTLSIFTENQPGLLHRVTVVFTRRKLNIDSITASESEIDGLYRYTIVVTTTKETAQKVIGQLEKQVAVIKAFVHEECEVIHQEIALYKISLDCLGEGMRLEDLVRNVNARILTVEKEFVVLEKTGHPFETQALYDRLAKYGILEFVRSGRVAITRPMKILDDYIAQLEARYEKEQEGKP